MYKLMHIYSQQDKGPIIKYILEQGFSLKFRIVKIICFFHLKVKNVMKFLLYQIKISASNAKKILVKNMKYEFC